ncbi:MAG: FtsX-like permease family protein, partial [bacterium]
INEMRSEPSTRRSVLALLTAVALLHLLACANAANLLLGRAATRRREAAVRAALGAGAWRSFVFLVGEGVVLALIGGVVGVAVAALISRAIYVPDDLWAGRSLHGALGSFDEPSFGARGALFGAALTLTTALIVGCIPAISMMRSDLLAGLRAGARGMSEGGGTLRRPSLRGAVVALEAALAVLLLVSGGLMITSYSRMRNTDLGVESSHVLTFLLRPAEVRVPPSAAPAHIARVLAAITSVPGVESATVDGGAPVSGSARSLAHIVGQPVVPDADAPRVNRHYVAPDHFKTLGMRVLAGRAFDDGDIAGRQKVTIVSESAARTFWPNADPLGKRVWFGSSGTWANADSSAVVVGVVNDIATEALDERPNKNEFYTPYAQFTYAWRYYFVRTTGEPIAIVPQLRKAIASVEPDLPMTEVKPLGELIGSSWARHRFDAWLFGAFSALAIVLASAGIYAVVAYSVSTRTREIGIRMALGARRSEIVQLVLREGMALPLFGLCVGVLLALASTRILRASLYDVTPTDPVVFGGSVALLVTVSVLACLLPARRATRVDPNEALRSE